MTNRKFNKRQQRFIEELLVCVYPAQAAMRAPPV